MRKVRFHIGQVVTSPCSDVARIRDDEDVTEAVLQQVWDDLQTQIEVTIGGITMHAAAWQDPDHWAGDWAELLEVDYDDAPHAVASLLEQAVAVGDGKEEKA